MFSLFLYEEETFMAKSKYLILLGLVAMVVPDAEGVHAHNIITAYLNGFPGMKCVINEAGDSILSAGQTAKVLDYENGQWR